MRSMYLATTTLLAIGWLTTMMACNDADDDSSQSVTETPLIETPTPRPGPTAEPTPPPGPTAEPTLTPGPTAEPTPTPGPTAEPTPPPGPTAEPTPPPGPTLPLEPTSTPRPSAADLDLDGYSVNDGDCNDRNDSVYPGAIDDPYDGIDQDCDGADVTDLDEDGVDAIQAGGDDCDDNEPSVYPGAEEVPYDWIDQDCDGTDMTDVDEDGHDSSLVDGADCDDANGEVYPDALETCDALDNDCDGKVDEDVQSPFYRDADGDGYGAALDALEACAQPDGYVSDATDCRDTNDNVHPGALETCNEVDDDCDGEVDEDVGQAFFQDNDQDGFGDPTLETQACSAPAGFVANAQDCNDSEANAYPGALETCNEADDDCDGNTDEGVSTTYYLDSDGDGFGAGSSSTRACEPPDSYVENSLDCLDSDASIYPGADEVCNNIDDDCDTLADEGLNETYALDADQDGYGDPSITVSSCTPLDGFVTDETDCDDRDPTVHPGAVEAPNGVDDDCNGLIDDGVRPASCKEMRFDAPDLPDGSYYVDPDLDGPNAALKVYCDMTTDGGGWTLVARASDTNGAGDHEYRAAVGEHSLLNIGYSYGELSSAQYTLDLDKILPPAQTTIELQYYCYSQDAPEDSAYWSKVYDVPVADLIDELSAGNPDFLLSNMSIENMDGDVSSAGYYAFFGREYEGDARCENGYAGQSGIKFSCTQSGQSVMSPPSVWYLTHYDSENYTEVSSCGPVAGHVLPYYVGEVRFR